MRFTAINTNTYRYLHKNFLRNLTSLKLGYPLIIGIFENFQVLCVHIHL